MQFVQDNLMLVAVLGAVALLVVVAGALMRRVQVAGPNEAFLITGRKGRTSEDLSGQKVVMGASVFVWPVVQQLHMMDLSSRRLPVAISSAVTLNGIKVNLEGVAMVKVGGNEDAVRAAAQRFLNQQHEIETFTSEVLAGSLRSIVGTLTVEEIIRDRAAFASRVAEESEASLTGQGLVLDTFQIQDVRAEGSYLDDLGRPEAARVQKDASIAEAHARLEAERVRIHTEEEIAAADRDLAIKVAQIKAETDAAQANAAAAGPLAQAASDQDVLVAQERVATRRAELKERELDTEIRKPADAAAYSVTKQAEAERDADIARAAAAKATQIAAAEAMAEENRLVGSGERQRREELARASELEVTLAGTAERARRTALAEALELEGNAEAAAINARGTAEAEAMQVRAEALANYGDAAVIEMLVKILPEVVAKASEPMGNIDKLTVISTDGASELTRNVASNVAQGSQMLTDLTGVDLPSLLSALTQRAVTAKTPAAPAPAPAPAPAAAPQHPNQ